MARFSAASRSRLATCHPALQRLAETAIQIIDFAVIEGHRSVQDQQRLYAQGRTRPGKIVTNVDGVRVVGKHNLTPAHAMDLCPWKLGEGLVWEDRESFCVMGGIFLGLAYEMEIRIRWGGNWDRDPYFNEKADNWDMPHIELVQ